MEAWQHTAGENEEKIEKAASRWYVKTSFPWDTGFKSGIATS